MNKHSNRGSLLFELFIALAILSIGITSTLVIFSEALFVGRKNEERLETKRELNHLLFAWYANPNHVKIPEGGMITIPLEAAEGDSSYWCEIRSKSLVAKSGGGSESEEAKKTVSQAKPKQYYEVQLKVTRDEGGPVLNLNTVVMKTKQGNAS
mgnify:CR=1 FL=1